MEDAEIVFRNFSGRETMYNAEGQRNFCLFLEPEIAEEMDRDGWNIKYTKVREEGDVPRPYVQVAVNFKTKGRPPMVVVITSRGRTTFQEEELEILDWVDIAHVDLIIRPYEWAINGKTGIKAYLQSLYITIREDELQLKYNDVPEIGTGQQPLALTDGQDDIIDGEAWYEDDPKALEA